MVGSKVGLHAEDPTLATVLQSAGYATGQFGKNHLGDRNEHLPTVRGFDEFLGNLDHLNTEEEPEDVDDPSDPAFRARVGGRGVLRTRATGVDDRTEDPRVGKVGRQRIVDTGPLTRQRIEDVDEEFLAAGCRFMDEARVYVAICPGSERRTATKSGDSRVGVRIAPGLTMVP